MLIGGIALGAIILVLIEALILIGLVASERPFSAFFSFLITAGLLDLLFGTGIYSTVYHNPLTALGFAAGYIIGGMAWSFPKWWFHVRRLRERFDLDLESFKRRAGLAPHERLNTDQILNFHHSTSFAYKGNIPPLASNHKNLILTWMMYWPFSCLVTLFDEPFRKAFQIVFNAIQGTYQRISDAAFRGAEL